MNEGYLALINSYNGKPVWSVTVPEESLKGMMAIGPTILSEISADYRLESAVRVKPRIRRRDVEQIGTEMCGLVPHGYGVWLRAKKPYHYNMYHFENDNFIQGFISMCDSFQVDFRDYMYRYPFDASGNSYAFEGYAMVPFNLGVDAVDLDDVFEEEADNENVNEPFEVDD